MVRDYGKIGQELGTLAKGSNVTAPSQLDAEHARIVHSVSAKPPSEFDAEYSKRMVEAHQKAMLLVRDAAALSDKALAAFAKKTTATLQQQEKLLSSLPAKMPAPAGGPGIVSEASGAVAAPETPAAAAAEALATDPAAADHAAPGTIAADAAAADASSAEAAAAKKPPSDSAQSDDRAKPRR
jgi:hypothetical protein